MTEAADMIRHEQRELERATRRLFDQLVERLETPLTEQDEDALFSAVAVAALTGARRGMNAAVYMAEVQARRKGVQLYLPVELPDPEMMDVWAERYGGDDDLH